MEWTDVPQFITNIGDLKVLLQALRRLTVCGGCDFEKYSQYLDMSSGDTVCKTNNGDPTAFVEPNVSNFHSKII